MNQLSNYIVFQCYGNEGIFHECAYALLSLSRLYEPAELSNAEIWVYTDNPGWFSFRDCPLPLHFREIDKATIKEWKGKIDFVHRVKIELLKDFTAQRKGNILYTDTDVVFTHRFDKMLADIGAGSLYMHTMEGKVSGEGNPVLRKLSKHLAKGAQRFVNGKPLHELAMWNAGVLGFNTKYDHLLDKVLAFTDNEYPRFSKHIVEQFAFSVYFQEAGEIKAASPYILHYWNLKEARVVLASFFKEFKNKRWEELVKYSQLLQMPVLMQEKVNFLQNRSITGKLLKKQWAPVKQDWEKLIKQV
jgi:hypothetical protein